MPAAKYHAWNGLKPDVSAEWWLWRLCQHFWGTEVPSGKPHQTFWIIKIYCVQADWSGWSSRSTNIYWVSTCVSGVEFERQGDAVPVLQEFAVSASSSVKVKCKFLTSKAAGIKWEVSRLATSMWYSKWEAIFVVIIQSLSGLQMTTQHLTSGAQSGFWIQCAVYTCVWVCVYVHACGALGRKDMSVFQELILALMAFGLIRQLLGCIEHWGWLK